VLLYITLLCIFKTLKFEVYILGSGSAIPSLERSCSAQVVNLRENYLLVDCGEGTQLQMRKYQINSSKINHIFISHLHGDHYLGLIGFISSMNLLGRTQDLFLYAHADLKTIIDQHLRVSDTRLNFRLHFVPLGYEEKTLIMENKYLRVFSFPMKHRIPTCGFLFEEKERELRLDKQSLATYRIPVAKLAGIKQGDDYVTPEGKVIKNRLITLPPEPVFSYAYCSDTTYSKKVIEAIKGVHTLYHEATFLEDLKDRAKKTFHSTAQQAAKVALEAGVQQLYMGHFSLRYKSVNFFEVEAREIFERATIVNDGDIIRIY